MDIRQGVRRFGRKIEEKSKLMVGVLLRDIDASVVGAYKY
jgi:hypothetical protein